MSEEDIHMTNRMKLAQREISAESWQGNYWGPNAVIALNRQQFKKLCGQGKTSEALASLSSTYYSASGSAFARMRLASIFGKPVWTLEALWCLWRAVRLSDALGREAGTQGMTADQLDVRARILFKWGSRFSRKRVDDAFFITTTALKRNINRDTEVLLLMGLGEIQEARQQYKESFHAYRKGSGLVERGVSASTAVRFYRSLGAHYRRLKRPDPATIAENRALEIAQKDGGMGDQILKLQSEIAGAICK